MTTLMINKIKDKTDIHNVYKILFVNIMNVNLFVVILKTKGFSFNDVTKSFLYDTYEHQDPELIKKSQSYRITRNHDTL